MTWSKSLVSKVILIMAGLLIAWGIFFSTVLVTKVKDKFLASTDEMVRNSEKYLLDIASKNNKAAKKFLIKYIHNTAETQEKDLKDIAFDLYSGDETRIKEAVSKKALAWKERSKKNFEIISAIRLERVLKEIKTQVEKLREYQISQARDLARQMQVGLLVFSFIAILSFVLVKGFWLFNAVIGPIRILSEGTKRVAKGDFTHLLEVKSKDELGVLAASFNQMTEDLQKTTISKEYVENIIKSMIDTLVVVTPEGAIQTVNQATCDLLRYQSEELIEQPVEKIFEEEVQKLFRGTGLQKLIKRGIIKGIEGTYLTKDGGKVPVLFSGSVMRDRDNKIMGIVCIAHDITERKRTEEALQEAYRIINRSPAVAFLWKNAEGWPVEFVSDNVKDLFGYTAEEFTSGQVPYAKIVHPDDLERVAKEVSTFSDEKERTGFVHEPYRIITKDGKVIWLDDRTYIRRDKKGNITYYEGIVVDITDFMQIAGALRESEKRFALAMRGANDGLWDWNLETDAIYYSPQWKKMLGYEEDEVEHHFSAWAGLLHPEDRDKTVKYVETNLAGAEPKYKIEFRMRHKDGHYVNILSRGFIVYRESDGKAVRMVGTHIDITERKKTEEELRKLLLAIEQSPASVVVTARGGKIEYVNQKFIKVTGYSKEEAIGQNPRILSSGVHSPEFYKEMWNTILSGKEWRGEFCNRKKNGELYWEYASISPVFDELGEITHFVGVKEDITQKRYAAQELQRAKEDAEAANQAKSEFLANMSHELRTPLNAVIGFSEVLRDQYFGKLNEKQADYIKDILESGKHLLSLINDILDLSKVEAGKMELEPSQVNIKDLLENSLVMIKEKAHKHGIVLDLKVPEEMSELKIQADERKLKQVMFNLLSNSAKFTPDGGKISMTADLISEFGVRISKLKGEEKQSVIQNPKSKIEVCVADTGIGISPEDHEKIFEEFHQVRSSYTDKTPGTGLGLPLTKRLVEMHGGRIWVESEGEGKGSTFSFVIPVT